MIPSPCELGIIKASGKASGRWRNIKHRYFIGLKGFWGESKVNLDSARLTFKNLLN
jgi:hypothetical protein